jgi:hypothetical protein
MSRFGRSVAALGLGVALAVGSVSGQAAAPIARNVRGGVVERASARVEGRQLEEALKDLERRGLRIIYSSETVRSEMRVVAEPRATSLRLVLDELLSPHGLLAREGPGGSLLIVKDPRARAKRSAAPATPPMIPPSVATASAIDPVTATRFEETITVTDADSPVAPTGPPPLAMRTVDVGNLAGGFENIFRTLQALPGVTATEELGSRISVRGGSPDQNLTVIDGVEVHNPYRLFVPSEDLGIVGLASTFNPETIDSFALYPGAFDVRYGDRLSSLVVVTSRNGSDAEAFQGFGFFSLTDMNVVAEGRLPGRADGSWLVTARRTHFNLLAEPAIGMALPSFQDVQTKLSWRPRPRQRVSLLAMAGRERTRAAESPERDEGRSAWTRNHLVAVTMESSLGAGGSSRTVASLSRFGDGLSAFERSLDNSRGSNTAESIASGGLLEFELARDVAVRDLALRQEFVFRPTARHWLDVGAEAHSVDTRWAWTIAGARSQHQANASSIRLGRSLPGRLASSRDTRRFGIWVQDRIRVSSRLLVQPGLRVDHSTLTGRSTVSARVGTTLAFGAGWRFDAAIRLHEQSPGYEKLLQSDYFLDLSAAHTSNVKSERALHLVAGLQKVFGSGVSARVDAYYKGLYDLVIGRLETEDERAARLARYDVPAILRGSVPTRAEITALPANAGRGQAYGVDAHVGYAGGGRWAPLTGWAGYSFGRATRSAYGVTYPFDYDRRHAATVAANVKIGTRLDLSATGRWAAGVRYTPVRGVRLALVGDVDDADGDGNREEQVPQRDTSGHPLFQPDLGHLSNINSGRLPRFARLDARLSYRPGWGGERWAFYADFLNVLNARNLIQMDSALVLDPSSDRPGIIERGEDRGIPFFPSFGIRVWF